MGCSSSAQVAGPIQNIPKTDGIIVKRDSIPGGDDKCKLLTKEQCVLVRNSWIKISVDNAILGKKIFLHIFELRPEIKLLFPFREEWGDSLMKHPQFRAHTARFALVIANAVENLERIDTSMGTLMSNLGRAHVDYKGFNPTDFNTFTESMLFVIKHELKEHCTDEVYQSWRVVIEFLVGKLSEGYLSEQADRNKQASKAITHTQLTNL